MPSFFLLKVYGSLFAGPHSHSPHFDFLLYFLAFNLHLFVALILITTITKFIWCVTYIDISCLTCLPMSFLPALSILFSELGLHLIQRVFLDVIIHSSLPLFCHCTSLR